MNNLLSMSRVQEHLAHLHEHSAQLNGHHNGHHYETPMRASARRPVAVADQTAGRIPKQIERLNNLTPAAGERHDEGNMAVIDR